MVVGYLVPRRYVKLAFFFRIDDRNTACIEHDAALQRVMIDLLADHTELFKQFSDNPSFKKWLGDPSLARSNSSQQVSRLNFWRILNGRDMGPAWS